ncbi:MAG: succinate--CoA ligase subunit alpha [Rhodobacter sp.]|nr:succinate--CoA ligase subunit alpha [Rhodobacter sp.]
MSILIDDSSRVLVQGMTGRAGTFYTDLAMRYGSHYVAGVRPGKGGTRHLDLPVFDTPQQAIAETGANASLIMVPAHHAADAMVDAIKAGIGVIVCVTERVPQHDMTRVKAALAGSDSVLIGPNSQGILTPGVCKIGVMPTFDARPGPVGIVSRSASLTSEILAQTSAANLGQSTTVGIGGDAIHGLGFVDCLKRFGDDDQTEVVVLIGEIGGREEEDAAAYLSSLDYGKPVVALVVGREAPKEKRMGHAGTLSIFGSETAQRKIELLQNAGVRIAANADDVVPCLRAVLG